MRAADPGVSRRSAPGQADGVRRAAALKQTASAPSSSVPEAIAAANPGARKSSPSAEGSTPRSLSPSPPAGPSGVTAARPADFAGGPASERQGGRGEEALRALSREVAELRSQVKASSVAVGDKAGAGRAADVAAGAREESRDFALRKLGRDVAKLRAEVEGVSDKVRRSGVGRGEGGGSGEAVRKLSREAAELRAQLEQARKEQAMTQLALRRLREQVDALTARIAGR